MTESDSRAEASAEVVARLVQSPVFVLSTIRAGSTLLRVTLNSHGEICAPHELHLRALRVQVPKALAAPAMAQLGLDQVELEHLLWDRILHRELQRSGKSVIVDKTPANAFMWERISQCWPRARFIFLLRNPSGIVDSVARARPEIAREKAEREVLGYARGVEAARSHLRGHVVRYEELTAEPERCLKELCRYLDVSWDPSMLAYGDFDHGPLRAGLGDWSDRIQSGVIQEARPVPAGRVESPELALLTEAWGYATDGPSADLA